VAKLTSEVEARRGEVGGRSEVRSIGLWATLGTHGGAGADTD
jgi:hypothetical protein